MGNGQPMGLAAKIVAGVTLALIFGAAGLYTTVTILKERDTAKKEKIEVNVRAIDENENAIEDVEDALESAIEGVEEDIADIKTAQQELGFEQRLQGITIEAVNTNVKAILNKLNNSP